MFQATQATTSAMAVACQKFKLIQLHRFLSFPTCYRLNLFYLDVFSNTDEGFLQSIERGRVHHLQLDLRVIRAPQHQEQLLLLALSLSSRKYVITSFIGYLQGGYGSWNGDAENGRIHLTSVVPWHV